MLDRVYSAPRQERTHAVKRSIAPAHNPSHTKRQIGPALSVNRLSFARWVISLSHLLALPEPRLCAVEVERHLEPLQELCPFEQPRNAGEPTEQTPRKSFKRAMKCNGHVMLTDTNRAGEGGSFLLSFSSFNDDQVASDRAPTIYNVFLDA